MPGPLQLSFYSGVGSLERAPNSFLEPVLRCED
jgi:hypothetical protein